MIGSLTTGPKAEWPGAVVDWSEVPRLEPGRLLAVDDQPANASTRKMAGIQPEPPASHSASLAMSVCRADPLEDKRRAQVRSEKTTGGIRD